jgi:hypothetical protein
MAASSDPSVASRIFVGKTLIGNLLFALAFVRADVGLVQQPQQESYRHQDYEDHGKREEAQPEPFHPDRALTLAILIHLFLLSPSL